MGNTGSTEVSTTFSTEETIVDKFAYGLHQVIRDNLPNTIKIGDISVTDGVNIDELSEEISKKITENLNKFSKETMVGTGEKIERKV